MALSAGMGSLLGGLGGAGISSAFGLYAQNQAEKNQGHYLQKQQDFNAEQASINRSWSASEADKARQFSKNAYKRQVQWRVADMRKAGINPILAVGGGLTGAMGNANQASGGSPATSSLQSDNSINSGLSAMQNYTNWKTALAEIGYKNEVVKRTKAETKSAEAKSLTDMVDAAERWLQHDMLYRDSKSAKISSEMKDYPNIIKGPARSLAKIISRDIVPNSAKGASWIQNWLKKNLQYKNPKAREAYNKALNLINSSKTLSTKQKNAYRQKAYKSYMEANR